MKFYQQDGKIIQSPTQKQKAGCLICLPWRKIGLAMSCFPDLMFWQAPTEGMPTKGKPATCGVPPLPHRAAGYATVSRILILLCHANQTTNNKRL
ncbi:MAG TPA: hypothetical protein IAA99_03975 [Candidatus Avibacteroides faecavium]|nr:hypothetical protein [Candidatus Avibacteroides faecavium]